MVEINYRIAPFNKRVIFVGDSFTYRSTFSSGAPADATHSAGVWNFASNGQNNRQTAVGIGNWLRYLLQGAMEYDGTCNYGVFGQKTPAIVARLPAILAADNADTVVIPFSINDFDGSATVVADGLAAIETAVQLCQNAGRFLYITTPVAAGDSSGGFYSTQAPARMAAIRALTDTYRHTPGVRVINMDPGYASMYSGDGRALDAVVSLAGGAIPKIHPSNYGAFQLAMLMLPAFQARFGTTPMIIGARTNSDNVGALNPKGSRNSNPALDGTTGTVGTQGSGQLANGFTGGNSGETGHTRLYAKVAAMPKTSRPGVSITLGGTTVSTADISLMFITMSGQTIGDRVRLAIEIDSMTGLAGLETVSAVINANGATFAPGVADMHSFEIGSTSTSSGSIGPMAAEIPTGLLLTPAFELTSATPRIILSARALSGSALAGTINVLSMSLIGA